MSDDEYDQTLHVALKPASAMRGRGATCNLPGRFEVQTAERYDDGWGDEFEEPARQTEVVNEQAKSIISRNRSPDIPFNLSVNPYRGCEHGCIYCFARPSHSYLGLSPGLDFETRIFAKVNAPERLRQELAKPSYTPEPIALGVNTDAYQPCERKLQLTRQLLGIFRECQHPVGLITKSSLIERDIDVLADMADRQQAVVTITLTTLDHSIARTLEPRATAPARRLRTVERLAAAGIPVGVNVAPVIPFVTDAEIERILQAAADAGACSASYIVLRLPWEVGPLFQQWLEVHFPDRARRVMTTVRDLGGGKDYEPAFGQRMRGQGVFAQVIRQRFDTALKRAALTDSDGRFAGLDASCFRPPNVLAAAGRQLNLFS